MVDNISLGKGRKAQQLDLAKMQQGGIIREAKDEKNESIFSDDEKKIFDSVDKNGGKANGVLDKEELNKFLEDLKDAAGNGRLSKREANKFLKEHGLKDIDSKTLFSFVDKISQSSENIKSCQMDAEGNIIIEYNDDKTETINSENQTSTIQSNDGKITEEYNSARELTKKTVKENETDSTTTEYSGVDADGNPIPTKETVISEENKTTTTTTFENGKKTEVETSKNNGEIVTTTTLDENEKPKTEVETQGAYTVINREYVDGEARVTSRIDNKGLDTQKDSTYEYTKDGFVIENSTELGGAKKSITITKDNVLISKDIVEIDKSTRIEKNNKGGYTENITEGSTVTQNELNAEMNRLSQTKQVGTKQYQLTYDGTGNTTGIIVQNGESPASIAKKFGVPLDKLLEANADKLNGKKYFAVGEEIKIPREMEADEKVLQGRKDAQGAKAEYAQDQARIQAERAARRQQIAAENKIYKQLGIKNRKGAGTTIKDNKGNKYTVVGQAGFGRTIAKDKKGNVHVIAHDGVDLKTNYVAADIANVKAGKKRIVVNGRAYYTDGAARDRHGRMNVTDWTGKKAILSGGKSKTDLSDRVILKNNYVEATDALDAGRGKKTYLDNGIQYVKSSDGKYWYFNEKGQAINAEQVEKQVAEKVAADLDDAADGWFFGAGTDEALMSKANAGISSPGILSKIEAHYQNKGFKANSEYKTAYEAFQGSELQRSEVYVNNAQLVKNNAIQDQSRRDEIISTNITEYGKTNENLQAGLDAIGNRTDFENANKAAQKYNQEKGYNPQFKNQSPINTLIYGQSDGDAESIRAANNKLIDPQENFLTSEEITRTLAEEGVYFLQEAKGHTIMQGLKAEDKDAALESNNADVYAMMDTLLKEKGEPSLKDTVDSARLATVGYGNFSADERAKLALDELMSSLNYTKSAKSTSVGSMTMGTSFSSTASIISDSKNAGLSINTLYKVLNSPESYQKFKELVNKNPDLKNYLTTIGFDESKLLFEAKSSNLSQDKIDNNKALVEVMKQAILQNRNEFQNITGQEGAIDSFLNRFRTTYGLGVTRETLSLLGQNSSYMLHNLELAAEGKLTDSKGTPISFEDYAKELNISTQAMEEANVTYQTHQAYARMGLDVATTIATIPVGAGAVKILSTVANGVKTFKVVQTLDAAGKTVKEIGVVKKLADAQKLATTTAKAFLAESKAGQATIKVAQNLTSSANIARSTTMGLTNGTVMYGKERLNQVTSTQGDNMVARSEAENNFASNSAAAGVGFHVGAGVAPLDDLGAVGRALGAATEITSDAATSAAINYAQTGEAFVSKEDMATSIIFNVAGHTSVGKGHSKAPKVETQGVLEHATGNGSHQSGGKLNPEKMEAARQQVADVAQHGTPQEVAHVHNEADLQQAQSRPQGRELKHVIEDNAGFVAIGKERIALDSSDFDALARAKKEVSNWADGTRDKEAILAKINKRMDEINAGQVKPTEPARGVDVVEHINDKVNQNAEHILDGNTGAIGSHDAATLRDQLANNLKSEGEIEQFIADIKQRVGVDEKGNMHVYQVQGKDHAADLVNAAEKKLKDIKANKANFEEASSILDKANAAGKGLSEDELKTLKSVAGKMTDPESLQSLIDKMKSNKKIKGHSGAKKAIGEMEAQVQTLKKAEAGHVQKAQTAEEPQGASDGSVADFAAEQNRMIAEGKLNPDGTPVETQPKAKPDETPIETQPKAKADEAPATHKVEEPQGVSDKPVADFAAEQKRMIAEGKLNPDGTPIETQPKVKADETLAVRNASEQKVSDAPANSAEVKQAAVEVELTPQKVAGMKKEAVALDKEIKASSEIPAQQKQLWTSVKEKYEVLLDSVKSMKDGVKSSALVKYGKEVLQGLQSIAKTAPRAIKQKLAKMAKNIQAIMKTLTVQSSPNRGVLGTNPKLDKYVVNPNKPAMKISQEAKELARDYGTTPEHVQFYMDNKELFKGNTMWDCWSGFEPKNQKHGAWKMHMYSVDEKDWQKMSEVLIPYLRDHDIDWKTFNIASGADHLNGGIQEGKAFTIYPRDNAHMEQVAKDLDYIIRNNNLETSGSNIVGDRAMGDNGRLFYRYEYNTGAVKDEVLDLAKATDKDKYFAIYDSNSGRVNRHGEGRYLADDMSAADDPWLNFNPADPKSHATYNRNNINESPVQKAERLFNDDAQVIFAEPVIEGHYTADNFKVGDKLPKDQGVIVASNAKLLLADQVELDLSSPKIQSKLKNLKDGQSLTIGREGDIVVGANNSNISRKHLTIEKSGNEIIVKDISTNGTKFSSLGDEVQVVPVEPGNSSQRVNNSQDIIAEPVIEAYFTADNFKVGDKLPKDQGVIVASNAKLLLADQVELDLSSPKIQSKLKNLKDGQSLTIGREGDIVVGANNSNISRKHLTIEKSGNEIIVKDISTNGTKFSSLGDEVQVVSAEPVNNSRRSNNSNFQGLSEDIKSTFSENTQQNLKKLKNGQSVSLTKGDRHYVVKNNNGQIVIETSLDANELVRVKGNNGKEINSNYVQTSIEAREYLQDAIESGQYTDSFESYVQTMNNMHKVSATGRNGNNEWYSQAGNGSNSVNPGQIRGSGSMVNHRTNTAIEAEEIAKQYGDSYRVETTKSQVNLKGIPDKYKPTDYNYGEHAHQYPDGDGLGYYYKEMHRTAKETLDLINNGASEQKILKKIAEHYQYAANARPYGQINNSLFMNEINTLLQKAGLKTIPHGNLDQISMHLQPETFQRYFIDQYYQTAL